jgi:hypothetical protein
MSDQTRKITAASLTREVLARTQLTAAKRCRGRSVQGGAPPKHLA